MDVPRHSNKRTRSENNDTDAQFLTIDVSEPFVPASVRAVRTARGDWWISTKGLRRIFRQHAPIVLQIDSWQPRRGAATLPLPADVSKMNDEYILATALHSILANYPHFVASFEAVMRKKPEIADEILVLTPVNSPPPPLPQCADMIGDAITAGMNRQIEHQVQGARAEADQIRAAARAEAAQLLTDARAEIARMHAEANAQIIARCGAAGEEVIKRMFH